VANDSPHSKKLQELMFKAWETFGDARHLDSDDRVFVQALARQTADRISVLYGSSWRDALDWVAQRYVPAGDEPGGSAAPATATPGTTTTASRRSPAAVGADANSNSNSNSIS
jgi:hypothetical protein